MFGRPLRQKDTAEKLEEGASSTEDRFEVYAGPLVKYQ